MVWGSGSESRSVNGPNSSRLKYNANLCGRCNNERSQPFDMAYDRYSDFVWNNIDRLYQRRSLDMRDVYGGSWTGEVPQLARYFAKHLGCRMSDDGYQPPSSLNDFLNGAAMANNVEMTIFKDAYLRRLRAATEITGLWMWPADGSVSKSRGRLTKYRSALSLGPIGVMVQWDEDVNTVSPFYNQRQARIYKREQLLLPHYERDLTASPAELRS